MRIGIDLDGVGYDFATEFTGYVSGRMGVTLPHYTHWNSHQKHWGLTHAQMLELMCDALQEDALWRDAAPFPGFPEATWALTDAGHTVVIATDRLQDTEHARLAQSVTRDWLATNRIIYDELIFTADKRDANADIFIDDRPGAIPTLLLAGVDAVYMDRPWNEAFPYKRVRDWEEFVQYVEDHNVR
jgi:5'(3')-deoxyribonucleotidase